MYTDYPCPDFEVLHSEDSHRDLRPGRTQNVRLKDVLFALLHVCVCGVQVCEYKGVGLCECVRKCVCTSTREKPFIIEFHVVKAS